VMRQLKESESTRDIPVIIVTGKVDAGTRSRILELGANDFVAKPFDVIELRKMIRGMLDSHN